MKAWTVYLTCNNQLLGWVDTNWGIYQSNSFSPLLLHTSESVFDFSNSGERVNHFLYINNLKLLAKNKKGLTTCSDKADFQWWYLHEIWCRQFGVPHWFWKEEKWMSLKELFCHMVEYWIAYVKEKVIILGNAYGNEGETSI